MVDTAQEPRLSRIFSNRVMGRYPAFEEFYGMEEAIEQIVSYLKHAAQGLEEKKQILYLLGPVGGVLLVLSRGEWAQLLAFRLVPGDLFMLLATLSWAFYSWLLASTREPAAIRSDWAAFLMAQMVFGLAWSGSFAGLEWAGGHTQITWGWPLVAALVFIAVGPAVLAYRCWGVGVQRAGPAMAGFFINLTPLFAGLLSAAFLGETPEVFHGLAFALIVGGIAVSSRSSKI